uniref:Uncharacterized protein n=1 Tax=Erythrolobus australicus TaxID=1077150 RepID=A0A7S1XIJ0_9RHOD|mmetsp:Transcript_2446/g.6626  ORF Transcript_2446/g.6626 Transcript_2446/m.6626 type:complete len:517 (+) Transcript_2446:49-1599(+)
MSYLHIKLETMISLRFNRASGTLAIVLLLAICTLAATGKGAVLDLNKIARDAAKSAVAKRIAARQDQETFHAVCETSVAQSSYQKPFVTFIASANCSETGEEPFSQTVEVPVDITGIPVTDTCTAEMYLKSVNCGASARLDVTVISRGQQMPSVTFDDLHAWSYCNLQGEVSCGNSYLLDNTEVEPVNEAFLQKVRFEAEFNAGSMKSAFAMVYYGSQNINVLFTQVKAKAGLADLARYIRTSALNGATRQTGGGSPLILQLMQGSIGGLSFVSAFVPGGNIQSQMNQAIQNAGVQQATPLPTASPTALPPAATPSPSPVPTQAPIDPVTTATPSPIPTTAPTSPPTPTPNVNPQPSAQPENSALPTQTQTPMPSPTSTPTPTPAPVCVDASWVAANHAGFEVHSTPITADVLCYKSLPCATSGHVVALDGKLMTMAELCAIEDCSASTMPVNGVQHRRALLMPCDGAVCMTTLDARSNTVWKRAENAVVYRMLQAGHAGLAEQLTRIQLAASARV